MHDTWLLCHHSVLMIILGDVMWNTDTVGWNPMLQTIVLDLSFYGYWILVIRCLGSYLVSFYYVLGPIFERPNGLAKCGWALNLFNWRGYLSSEINFQALKKPVCALKLSPFRNSCPGLERLFCSDIIFIALGTILCYNNGVVCFGLRDLRYFFELWNVLPGL